MEKNWGYHSYIDLSHASKMLLQGGSNLMRKFEVNKANDVILKMRKGYKEAYCKNNVSFCSLL